MVGDGISLGRALEDVESNDGATGGDSGLEGRVIVYAEVMAAVPNKGDVGIGLGKGRTGWWRRAGVGVFEGRWDKG